MATETRTVQYKIDAALQAYWAWLQPQAGREFDLKDFDLFAAGYRARCAEIEDAPAEPAAERTGGV